MRSRADTYAARKNGPRRNVRVGFHDTVVINDGTCIDYGISANPASGLKNRPCHNLGAISNLHFRSDDGRGMYHAARVRHVPPLPR